jgi:hypothetical protein
MKLLPSNNVSFKLESTSGAEGKNRKGRLKTEIAH